jgi:hypothetical protein
LRITQLLSDITASKTLADALLQAKEKPKPPLRRAAHFWPI